MTFFERLSVLLGTDKIAEQTRQLDISYNTLKNYKAGRLPSPEVLISIVKKTGVNLNWLLLGHGKMLEEDEVTRVQSVERDALPGFIEVEIPTIRVRLKVVTPSQ